MLWCNGNVLGEPGLADCPLIMKGDFVKKKQFLRLDAFPHANQWKQSLTKVKT